MSAVVIQQQREPTAAESNFALTVRQAKALAASELVPKSYQGENGLANVMVALEIANRIGASPLSVMQSLHIIQGRPSWSASFLIATVNACGRFTPMRFETIGDNPTDKTYRVRAHAKDKDTGEVCEGPWITWQMVDAEGWSSKTGSKWKTMPALMFMYRAAAFWTRVYAPELSLGIHTAEEVQDFTDRPHGSQQRAEVLDLQQALIERGTSSEVAEATTTTDWHEAAQSLHDALTTAADRDTLDDKASLIGTLPEDLRAPLYALYTQRCTELENN